MRALSRLRLTVVIAALSAPVALAGCGDDEETTTTSTVATGASGASGTSGAQGVSGTVTADEVAECINGAGLEATVSGDELIGIDVPHEVVDVALEDLDQGAAIAVFESAEEADAQADAADVVLGVADTEVAGNTVWGIDSSVSDTAEAEDAIPGCLPSS